MHILSTAHATANFFFTKVVKSIFNGKGTDYHVSAGSIPSHEMPHLPFMNTRQKLQLFRMEYPEKELKPTSGFTGEKKLFQKIAAWAYYLCTECTVHWFLRVVPLLSLSERCLIAVIYRTETQRVTQVIYLLALLFSSKLWSNNHRPRDNWFGSRD